MDGDELAYKLTVANIQNVFMAHVHRAPAGQNGTVVTWLYPESPPPELIEGGFDGVLAEGVITADDLVGPLAGKTLDVLVAKIRNGTTYLNVLTTAHPHGEIRGQVH